MAKKIWASWLQEKPNEINSASCNLRLLSKQRLGTALCRQRATSSFQFGTINIMKMLHISRSFLLMAFWVLDLPHPLLKTLIVSPSIYLTTEQSAITQFNTDYYIMGKKRSSSAHLETHPQRFDFTLRKYMII